MLTVEKMTKFEDKTIILDAILDELAMGTVFTCMGEQLKNPLEIVNATRDGREIAVEYHCKWCGVPCSHSHWCEEHQILNILREI